MSTVTRTESYCHSQFDPSRMAVIHRITINGLITEILQVNRDGTSDDGTPWLVGMIRGEFKDDVTQSKLDELVPVPDYVKRSVFGWGHSFPDPGDGTKVFFFSTHEQRDLDYKTFVEDVFARRNAIADHTPNLIDYPSPGSDWYRTFQTAWNDDIRDGEAKLIQIGTPANPDLSEASAPENFPGIEALDPEALQAFFGDKPHVFYKVTTADLDAPYFGNFTFDPPKEDGTPGDWTPVHWPTVMCSHGIHITHEPSDWKGDYHSSRIFECEARGIQLPRDGSSKAVAATIRLTKEITEPYKLEAQERARQAEAERQRQAEEREAKKQQARDAFTAHFRLDNPHFVDAMMDAMEDGAVFLPYADAKDIVKHLTTYERCPHCGDHNWTVEKTYQEERIETVIQTFNAENGYSDYDYGDADYGSTYNEEYRYSCCGHEINCDDFTTEHGTYEENRFYRWYASGDFEDLVPDLF